MQKCRGQRRGRRQEFGHWRLIWPSVPYIHLHLQSSPFRVRAGGVMHIHLGCHVRVAASGPTT